MVEILVLFREFRSLVENFQQYGIPLDVLVVDMDWHYTDEGRGGWTGWTWNRNLFPDPAGFLKYLKNNDLKITLNLHPADGVSSYENGFSGMAKDLNLNSSTKNIPWAGSDKSFMTALFKNIFHPMQNQGVDFCWLDWQQFPFDKKIEGLSNTWWINYAFFSDNEKNGEQRPILYHRWGGLGNHRYQVGFSGDTHASWNSLDYNRILIPQHPMCCMDIGATIWVDTWADIFLQSFIFVGCSLVPTARL